MISDQQFSELLLTEGLISRAQLQEAKSFQSLNGGDLYTVSVENSFVEEEPTVVAVAGLMGIPCVSLREFEGSPDALDMVSADLAKRHRVIPLGITPDQRGVYLAMANPIDMLALDEISVTTGCDIIAFLAGPVDIAQALERCYGRILYDDRSIISSVFTMDQLADLGDLNNPLGEGFELFGDEELPPIEDLNLAFDLDGVSLQPEEEHQAPPILLTNEDLFGTSVAAPSHGDISALDLELELELELESIDLPDLDDEEPAPFAPIAPPAPQNPIQPAVPQPSILASTGPQVAVPPVPSPANHATAQTIDSVIPAPKQYDTLEELLRAVDPRFLQRSLEPVQSAPKPSSPPQPETNQLPPPKPVPPKPTPPQPTPLQPPTPIALAPQPPAPIVPAPQPPAPIVPAPQPPPPIPPPPTPPRIPGPRRPAPSASNGAPKAQLPSNISSPNFQNSPQFQPRQPKPRGVTPTPPQNPAPLSDLPGITGFLTEPEDNSVFGAYSDFMSGPSTPDAPSEPAASLLYLESRRKAANPPKSQRRKAVVSQVAPFPEELSQVAIKPLFQPQQRQLLPPAIREAPTRALLLTVLDVLVRNDGVSIAEILNTMARYEDA